MRALLVGRFQPFHNGHLQLVKDILRENDEIIIAIASAQFNYLEKDPFTAGERVYMIHEALMEADVDLSLCYILPLVNDENNARWVAYLRTMLPRFDRVYSGNEYVATLFKEYGVEVRDVKFYDREKYNATRIRKLMIEDKEWRDLVPDVVARIIDEINGIKRMKIISREGSRPQEW